MWKEINKDLIRNDSGQAIIVKPDKNGKPTPFFIDDSLPEFQIPIIDFMENPFYKYSEAWKELKRLVDINHIDIAYLYQNSSALFVNIVASEYLPSFYPVHTNGFLADSNKIQSLGRCFGISIDNIVLGTSGRIQSTGTIENPSWNFTPNQNVFLNGKGILSQTLPLTGFVQKIGTANKYNSLILSIADPITL